MEDQETLTADTPEVRAADTRTPDPFFDTTAEYLRGGALTAAEIIRRVFQNPSPDQDAVDALEKRLAMDPRFVAMADGWDLVGLPPAEGKSIADCIAANEASADKLADAAPTPIGDLATMVANATAVTPIEGVGSETIASETPSPAAVITAAIMDAGAETIARLRGELATLRDELDAYKDRAAQEKVLTDAIVKKGAEVVAAKEVLAGKKAALATAHEELFAFVSGDTQTKHPDLKGEDDEDEEDLFDGDDRPAPVPAVVAQATTPAPVPESAATADPVKPFVHDVAVDSVLSDHNVDLLRLRACLRRDIIPSEKPLQVGTAIVELKGCQWLVRDHNDEQTRWFLQRVLSKDEWDQMHEKEFGRWVKGFDQNDEAKHHRQQGGTECGLVVKVGRKDGVLGPEREGLVLVLPKVEAEKVIDGVSAFDAKAAAAGDSQPDGSLRNEQESFVAGDTPGGVVNSDPND